MNNWLTLVPPILIGLVQAVKAIPAIKARTWLVPFLAAGVGVLLTYVVENFPATWRLVLPGLSLGLASTGLYEAGKGVLEAGRASSEK
jgi:hypothetical protein